MAELIEAVSGKALSDVDKLIEKLKTVNTEITNINNKPIGSGRGVSDNRQAISEIERLNRLLSEQGIEIQRLTTVRTQANQRTQEEITNTRLLARNASMAAQANSTFANSYQRLTAQQAIAASRVQDLIARGRTAEQTQRQYNRELRNAQGEFDRLNTRVVSANRAVNRFNDNVGNYPQRAIVGLKDLVGAFGLVGGLTAFAMIAKDIFNTTRELQSLDLALKNVTGSQQVFAETQEFLSRISEAYGIEINGLTKSYTGFLAASQNAIENGDITAKQIQDIFESVSKASGAMGLSIDQQQGAFLALQQMISKGNVQAEEIRGQLGERLPGAFGILSKSMGVTEQELNKLLKDGKVLAAEVLPAFAKELEKAYGVETLDRVESLAASTTRLGNAWTAFIREISEGDSILTKFFIGTLDYLDKMLKGFSDLAKSSQELRDEQLNTITQSGYQEQLKLLNDMKTEEIALGTAVKDRLSLYAANETIESGREQLKNLREQRNALDEILASYEAQGKGKGNTDVVLTNNEYNKSLDQTNLILGQMKAAQEFLNKENEKSTKFNGGAAKAKTQKQDIDYLKEVYQLRKSNIENEIEGQDYILNNEQKNYSVRLDAANNYLFQKQALIDLEKEEQLRLNDINLKTQTETYRKAISDGKASYSNLQEIQYQHVLKKENIDAEYEGKKAKLAIESATKLQGVLDAIEDKRRSNVVNEQELNNVRQLNSEVGNVTTDTSYKKFKELEDRKTEIVADATAKRIQIELQRTVDQIATLKEDEKESQKYQDLREKEISLTKQLADAETDRLEKTKALTLELKKATEDYLNGFTESFLSNAGFDSLNQFFKMGEDGLSEFEKRFKGAGDNITKQFQVAFTSISEIVQEAFNFINQQQQARFDAMYANLQREKDLALQFAGESESGRAEIEKQYEEKRREIKRKEAESNKQNAIFNAIINTAQAVVSALPNVALSVIIGALGAAQIALIASQPIPQYKMGTDSHKGGLAIVGDGGKHEAVFQPSLGWSISPNKSTLVDLEKGSKVFPDLASSGVFDNGLPDTVAIPSNGVTSAQMDRLFRKHMPKQNFNVEIGKGGLRTFVTTTHSRTENLNDRVRFGSKKV